MINKNKYTITCKLLFLAVVLATTSGYRFRCWWGCIDQTAIQHDYVEQRDRCREYASLKLDMAMRNNRVADKELSRKAQMITLFSDCMGNNGWSVPDARAEQETQAIGSVAPGAGFMLMQGGKSLPQQQQMANSPSSGTPVQDYSAQAAAAAGEHRAALSRSAECSFARSSASASSIAAARAKACDLECAQRLRAAPEAPRPAACPLDPQPDIAAGVERTD